MNKDIFNYFDVDEQTKELARECCKTNNYELQMILKESNHPDDHFLNVVLAYNPNASIDGYQYAVWTFNGRGLDNGAYASTFKNAFDKMQSRIYDVNEQQMEKIKDNVQLEHTPSYSDIYETISKLNITPIQAELSYLVEELKNEYSSNVLYNPTYLTDSIDDYVSTIEDYYYMHESRGISEVAQLGRDYVLDGMGLDAFLSQDENRRLELLDNFYFNSNNVYSIDDNASLDDIAFKLTAFAQDYDLYGFDDSFSNYQEAFNSFKDRIVSGNTKEIIETLDELIAEDDRTDICSLRDALVEQKQSKSLASRKNEALNKSKNQLKTGKIKDHGKEL